MKILVAPDSFKGSLSALNFCEICEAVFKKKNQNHKIISMPLADGGEGSLECIKKVKKCSTVQCYVQNSLYEEIEVPILFFDDGKTAFIETSLANGLPQIKGRENPEITSTYGVGQMIGHAVDLGAKKIILGLGGSSTNDCGLGMLAALGACFYNKEGISFVPTGGTLCEIVDMDFSMMYPRLQGARFEAMCDVSSPLCGENGASKVFAPQKGADDKMIAKLEEGCKHVADLFNLMRDTDFSLFKGAGAAGGLGFAVLAGLLGKINSGIETILSLYNFDSVFSDCDLLITGEGSFDSQSMMGKTVGGLINKAGKTPVYVFCGKYDKNLKLPENVHVVCISENQPLEYAINHATENLEAALFKTDFCNNV